MKNWFVVVMLVMAGSVLPMAACGQNDILQKEIYAQLSVDDEAGLHTLLEKIGEPETTQEAASKGVVLMKFAEYQKTPGDKLSTFKEGHALLEEAIAKEPDNMEYLFFRLIIQENAPRILGYNENIEADSASIVASYSGLSQDLKNAILAYSKTSKVLNSEDLE